MKTAERGTVFHDLEQNKLSNPPTKISAEPQRTVPWKT